MYNNYFLSLQKLIILKQNKSFELIVKYGYYLIWHRAILYFRICYLKTSLFLKITSSVNAIIGPSAI
jgi:hypothetical protein